VTERKLAEAARVLARQGDANAQYSLGNMYRNGQGVPQDYAESVRWFREAAGQGDAKAQNGLAYMYDTGKGVSQDHAEAVRWYRKAADQGDVPAQSYLGYRYFHGQGVPQDYAEAIRWYRKAAGQGDGAAQSFLTVSYFKGRGVPRNYAEAGYWLGKVVASCFAKTERGPLARGTFIVGLLLGLTTLLVPQRLGRRAPWLPLALLSVTSAIVVAHELSLLALLPRELLGTLSRSPVRVLVLVLFAGLSVISAIGAIVGAVRGSKHSGQLPPPEGSLESPT